MHTADFQCLDTEILADAVRLMHDIIAGFDVAEMHDALAGDGRTLRAHMALAASKNITLCNDNKMRSCYLHPRHKISHADIDGTLAERLILTA